MSIPVYYGGHESMLRKIQAARTEPFDPATMALTSRDTDVSRERLAKLLLTTKLPPDQEAVCWMLLLKQHTGRTGGDDAAVSSSDAAVSSDDTVHEVLKLEAPGRNGSRLALSPLDLILIVYEVMEKPPAWVAIYLSAVMARLNVHRVFRRGWPTDSADIYLASRPYWTARSYGFVENGNADESMSMVELGNLFALCDRFGDSVTWLVRAHREAFRVGNWESANYAIGTLASVLNRSSTLSWVSCEDERVQLTKHGKTVVVTVNDVPLELPTAWPRLRHRLFVQHPLAVMAFFGLTAAIGVAAAFTRRPSRQSR